jgi:hypothetical protein
MPICGVLERSKVGIEPNNSLNEYSGYHYRSDLACTQPLSDFKQLYVMQLFAMYFHAICLPFFSSLPSNTCSRSIGVPFAEKHLSPSRKRFGLDPSEYRHRAPAALLKSVIAGQIGCQENPAKNAACVNGNMTRLSDYASDMTWKATLKVQRANPSWPDSDARHPYARLVILLEEGLRAVLSKVTTRRFLEFRCQPVHLRHGGLAPNLEYFGWERLRVDCYGDSRIRTQCRRTCRIVGHLRSGTERCHHDFGPIPVKPSGDDSWCPVFRDVCHPGGNG